VRAWLVAPLLICVACSREDTHSGSLPESADFLPMVSDSVDPTASPLALQDTSAADSSEQPRLMLRCEQGRVSAYLVAGAPELLESRQPADARVVPVLLDSALSC
jgi:hypothetical protein